LVRIGSALLRLGFELARVFEGAFGVAGCWAGGREAHIGVKKFSCLALYGRHVSAAMVPSANRTPTERQPGANPAPTRRQPGANLAPTWPWVSASANALDKF